MPLDVGSRIAHYDVTALIGEGGVNQPATQRLALIPSAISSVQVTWV